MQRPGRMKRFFGCSSLRTSAAGLRGRVREQRLGPAGSSGESVAVTPVSWKTSTGGQERAEVAVKSMGLC